MGLGQSKLMLAAIANVRSKNGKDGWVHHVSNKSTFWVGPFHRRFWFSWCCCCCCECGLFVCSSFGQISHTTVGLKDFPIPNSEFVVEFVSDKPANRSCCCCCRFWLERLCSVSPPLMHSIIRFGSVKNKFYVAPSTSISDVLACGRLQRCGLAIILYSIPLHGWSESAQLLLKEV